MKPLRSLAVSLFLFLAWHSIAAGQSWQPLNNQPSFGASTSLLLTNGTVLVQGNNGDYWGLTPDNTGSYVNGTWTQLASLPPGYNPDAYASAVLRDGRVILEGGEYNNGQNDWTNQGAIYNPKTNKWKSVAPPSGWNIIGDAESVVLSDGTFMVANCCSFPYLAALLDATNLTWTPTGLNKQDSYDEEGWLLLPDGTVLTVDCENGADPKHAEKYIPSLGEWVSAGDTGVLLSDPPTAEIGPMVLRPDGTVFATGANSTGGAGHTSVYYPPKDPMSPGKWVPGPDIPDGNDLADAPAALLPDGNVLLDTSPGYGNPPSTFFEYNGTGYVKVPAPPNAAHESSEGGSMLELPTGQIFFTDGSSDVEIYTPKGHPQKSWAPTIASVPHTLKPGSSYLISGTQFNGLSQGAMYGDDDQTATNYPLVRITNKASGNVFYATTHDHSTMAVATGDKQVSTHFDVPENIETGPSRLVVVTNGIPSEPVSVTVQ